ncbi:hypothetical protein V3W47_10900 [Deinococcus sp. YIM 134068]|uniref:hypothetical protein n=1 Tax=Deinococcus lichenicola TaxID=3118910 RepID=UPI002F94302C
MRRLLPAFLGLSLLLTACPGTPPPTVSVSQDDRVLRGSWVGELVESVSVSDLAVGGGRVYLLDGSNWERRRLLVLDLASGARLASLPLSEAYALAYRGDGVLVVLGDGRLTLHDPVTLEVRETHTVAGNSLSLDGEIVIGWSSSPLRRSSTRTGEPLPTVPPATYLSDTSGDTNWWLIGGRAVRASDGQSAGGTSAHGNPCRVTQGLQPVSIESAPSGRVLLGFSDGVVELREADGTLVRAFTVSGNCLPVQDLRRVGEGVAFLTNGGSAQDGEAGVLDLSTGTVGTRQNLPVADSYGSRLTSDGVFLNSHRPDIARYEIGFQPWVSPRWALALEGRRLTLDVETTRRDDHTADVTGTATVDGQSLRVAGTLTGGGVLFAQWSIAYPTLASDLTLVDGSEEVGTLSSSVTVFGDTGDAGASPQPPAYHVTLNLEEGQHDYTGELRRP